MYNKDVDTRYHELSGTGSFQLFPSADRYVVGASIQQSGNSATSEILCNSTVFAKNYGKDFPFNEVSYHCIGAINLTKTGQDNSAFTVSAITTVNYQSSTVSGNISNINYSEFLEFI